VEERVNEGGAGKGGGRKEGEERKCKEATEK